MAVDVEYVGDIFFLRLVQLIQIILWVPMSHYNRLLNNRLRNRSTPKATVYHLGYNHDITKPIVAIPASFVNIWWLVVVFERQIHLRLKRYRQFTTCQQTQTPKWYSLVFCCGSEVE